METTVEKDLIIARQNSQIEEMILFMSHLDLGDTICAKMAKMNGEEEYGVNAVVKNALENTLLVIKQI